MAYEKLVRREVARRISYEPGSVDRLRQATKDEMPELCAEKVREELDEVMEQFATLVPGQEVLLDHPIVEELGDLMEAVEELRRQVGVAVTKVEFAQTRKRERLGALDGRWVLASRRLPPIHEECFDCDALLDYHHEGHRHCSVCDGEWPCPDAGARTGRRR